MTCVTACGRPGCCATRPRRSWRRTAPTSTSEPMSRSPRATTRVTRDSPRSESTTRRRGGCSLLGRARTAGAASGPADPRRWIGRPVRRRVGRRHRVHRQLPRASDDEIAEEQRRRIGALVDAGADLLAIETIPNGREAAILGELMTDVPDTESWVTFCCRDDHTLSDGTSIADAIRAVTRTGRVTAVGLNCTPPQHVESLLRDARAVTELPLVAYPNWGRIWDGERYEWIEGTGVVEFPAELLERWYAAGRASSAAAAASGRRASPASQRGARAVADPLDPPSSLSASARDVTGPARSSRGRTARGGSPPAAGQPASSRSPPAAVRWRSRQAASNPS